jgi:hypothetical protein
MGNLGVGIMNSMTFLLLSKSNSKIDGNEITFGAVDFQPHPPNLAPVFANLDQEMDLTIGILNFRIGSLGSVRLSDPVKIGPLAGKTASTANSGTLIGSSTEVNSPVSFEPMKNKGSTFEEPDKIMENIDLGESSGMASNRKIDNISKEDFTTRSGGVSDDHEDMWKLGVKLHDEKRTTPYSVPRQHTSTIHQVYVIINDTP